MLEADDIGVVVVTYVIDGDPLPSLQIDGKGEVEDADSGLLAPNYW